MDFHGGSVAPSSGPSDAPVASVPQPQSEPPPAAAAPPPAAGASAAGAPDSASHPEEMKIDVVDGSEAGEAAPSQSDEVEIEMLDAGEAASSPSDEVEIEVLDGSDAGEADDSESGIYAVEAIINEKREGGKLMYLLKWEGYSHKHNTWEPEEHIEDSALIAEWTAKKAAVAAAAGAKPAVRRRKPKPSTKTPGTPEGPAPQPGPSKAAGGSTSAEAVSLCSGEEEADADGAASGFANGAAAVGASDAAASSSAPQVADTRDQSLLARVLDYWLVRYTQTDLSKAVSVDPNQLMNWLRGKIGLKGIARIEPKVRAWAEMAEAKIEAGDEDGLPQQRQRMRRVSIREGDAGGIRGRGARGPRGRGNARGRGRGRGGAGGASSSGGEEVLDTGVSAVTSMAVEELDFSESESEGEGEHRVEGLLREMRQGKHRWLMVKWQGMPHEKNTWEPTRNLHEELVKDFDRRKAIYTYV